MAKGNKNGSGVKIRKNPYDHKRIIIVKKLSEEFAYTPEYIRQCLRGDSNALVVDDIKKRYNEIYIKLEAAFA